MTFLRSTLGFMFAGLFVMSSLWGTFGEPGISGGFLAAVLIIGAMWYLNHHVGLIYNKPGASFVDMALGIAVAGTLRDLFINGQMALIESLPTLFIVVLGGACGGAAAYYVEKDLLKKERD